MVFLEVSLGDWTLIVLQLFIAFIHIIVCAVLPWALFNHFSISFNFLVQHARVTRTKSASYLPRPCNFTLMLEFKHKKMDMVSLECTFTDMKLLC